MIQEIGGKHVLIYIYTHMQSNAYKYRHGLGSSSGGLQETNSETWLDWTIEDEENKQTSFSSIISNIIHFFSWGG